MSQDCIFCKIVAGEIPSKKVYEDEWTYAFEDANPCMPVHTLVVPKDHYANVGDDVPVEVLGHVLKAAAEVARIQGVAESGYRLCANTGDDARQTVHHLHVHVLGGALLPINMGPVEE